MTYLVVVWGGGAVAAEVAVNWTARVALVGVDFEIALGELESVLVGELVQSEIAAGLELAGVAVAENVRLRVLRKLDLPFHGAAVAMSFESLGHLPIVLLVTICEKLKYVCTRLRPKILLYVRRSLKWQQRAQI